MHLGQQLIDLVARNHNTLGLALLCLSACIEYLFPPFPGDMITVFGAFLVARRGWSGPAVFGAVTLGSAVGCMLDYAFGRWLGRTEDRWSRGRLARFRPQIDSLVARFARHGALYIAINRFIPSLRGLFFIAAGMARLPWWKVLLFGTLSALLWNGLLLLLGLTVGQSWDRLVSVCQTYALLLWCILGVAALALVVRHFARRSR
ncbi:MAG: DedA protein [Myxococcales bacterium]|nr:DedA protein [Myxococcales bacterium]